MNNLLRLLAACSLVVWAATAAAYPLVDQVSPYGDIETIDIGGDPNRIVAQVVTTGITGALMRVELGIGCVSGELILEIVRLEPGRPVPGTEVLSRTTVPAESIPYPWEPRTIDLASRPFFVTGEPFAIVLRNETGKCTAMKGPESLGGTSYAGGNGFFRPASGPPDAWLQFLDFGKTGDLGFRTIVNFVPSSPPCTVRGFPPFPFANWVPVCRCLQDEGLRDFRCALLHPSFFMARHIPMPIRAGERFKIEWTLTVFGSMKGVLELHDPLTKDFGNTLKAPLTFFVEQVPPGESITLGYEAIAPAKPGKYKVESRIGEGTMETVIEVLP